MLKSSFELLEERNKRLFMIIKMSHNKIYQNTKNSLLSFSFPFYRKYRDYKNNISFI